MTMLALQPLPAHDEGVPHAAPQLGLEPRGASLWAEACLPHVRPRGRLRHELANMGSDLLPATAPR